MIMAIPKGLAFFKKIRSEHYAILCSMNYLIAVDIGGTQIRAGCYPEDSLEPIRLDKISTRDPRESPLERLTGLVASIWPEAGEVEAIAVAAPGPIDPETGVVLTAPNIPGWRDVPLRETVENHFRVPAAVGNDANLAALGEWKFGAGKGHHHLLYLTISTGIGGGVIIDDRLLLGRHGLGGELGHVTILPDGPLCGCGQHGHLEALSSGTAIANWVQEQIEQGAETCLPVDSPITARMISAAAREGDPLATAAFHRAGDYLGIALANFLHIFNPSVVVLGGGVSRSGSLLIEPMQASLRERVLDPSYLHDLVIVPAAFGDDAGLMGALALASETAKTSILAPK
jgi:glucokinase